MEAVIDQLDTQGYAVTEPLLTPAECDAVVAQQWDFVEAASNHAVRRADPASWCAKNWIHQIHGIVQHYGVGHSAAAWAVRSHPKVVETFASVYEANGVALPTEPPARGLLASFDGFSIVKPQSQPHFGGDWLHVDQRSSKEGLASVQGLVNVGCDLGEDDHTFTCIPESHRQFGAFFRHHPEAAAACRATDWYKFKPEELGFFGGAVKVPVPKGAMLLWDSRLVHASAKSTAKRHKWRNVVYVCCTPRSWATPRALKRKRQHAVDGRTATHLAHDERLFPKCPRTYGKETHAVYQAGCYGDYAGAPAVVRQLAGFDDA